MLNWSEFNRKSHCRGFNNAVEANPSSQLVDCVVAIARAVGSFDRPWWVFLCFKGLDRPVEVGLTPVVRNRAICTTHVGFYLASTLFGQTARSNAGSGSDERPEK